MTMSQYWKADIDKFVALQYTYTLYLIHICIHVYSIFNIQSTYVYTIFNPHMYTRILYTQYTYTLYLIHICSRMHIYSIFNPHMCIEEPRTLNICGLNIEYTCIEEPRTPIHVYSIFNPHMFKNALHDLWSGVGAHSPGRHTESVRTHGFSGKILTYIWELQTNPTRVWTEM